MGEKTRKTPRHYGRLGGAHRKRDPYRKDGRGWDYEEWLWEVEMLFAGTIIDDWHGLKVEEIIEAERPGKYDGRSDSGQLDTEA